MNLSVRRAGFRLGLGELVSGDYASATDNLSIEVAEVIVDVALRNSTRVPESIRELAKAQLRPLFLYKGEEIVVSAGQQMGSLLSFPLLCTQNYIAFKYAVTKHYGREKVLPVLINGDDILYQVKDPLFFDDWMGVVSGIGLQVETSKTSRDSTFGTLNSTLLRWRGEFLRQVPTLRFGMLRSSEYANSLPAGLRDFAPKGLDPQIRFNAALEYIKWHRHTILKTGLSPQEIGFRGRLAWRVCLKAGVLRNPISWGLKPTLRFGMLRSSEYANSLPAGLRDFAPKGLDPQIRFNAALEYIKWHRHTILKTGLSPQEIGFRGRLAWRVCLKAGVLRTQKQVVLNEPLCS